MIIYFQYNHNVFYINNFSCLDNNTIYLNVQNYQKKDRNNNVTSKN